MACPLPNAAVGSLSEWRNVLLNGKAVLIFGASSGIGRATALRFGAAGAQVAVAARRRPELEQLCAEMPPACRGKLALTCDATARERVQEAVTSTVAAFGRLDVVVYATGTNTPRRAVSILPAAEWDELLATNLTGAFHATQAVLPYMRRQGDGLIIYIASTAARTADASGVAYQASKRGMLGLAGGTHFEERENGIRTTVLMPGMVDTPLLLKRPVQPDPVALAAALQPEDVAEACLFVASLPARAHVPELVIMPSKV
jgi:serine 3-dehydrogenase